MSSGCCISQAIQGPAAAGWVVAVVVLVGAGRVVLVVDEVVVGLGLVVVVSRPVVLVVDDEVVLDAGVVVVVGLVGPVL